MLRRAIAPLVVLLLAVLIVVFWLDSDPEPPVSDPSTTTTTTAPPATTTSTSVVTTTSTTQAGSHVVETVEEAEEIVAHHYAEWFQAIYEQNEDRIRSLVILESQVEAALGQFGSMTFVAEPSAAGVTVSDTEILEASDQCTAIFAQVTATFREGSTDGVLVFRRVDTTWKLLSAWEFREDLWAADCDSSLP